MQVPECGPAGPLDRRQEAGEPLLRIVGAAAAVVPEVLPALRDRRDALRELVGQKLVQVDDAGVGEERLQAAAERPA
jgi:hypothetical protein